MTEEEKFDLLYQKGYLRHVNLEVAREDVK